MTELICLYQHLCPPREGHLDAFYCIFGYLQKNSGKNLGRMPYNCMYEPTNNNVFDVVGIYLYEWIDFYPDAQGMIPRKCQGHLVSML